MKHPVSLELYEYWDGLRGPRSAPERADVDPSAIRGILANTFILEVDALARAGGRRFPIRLSGTRLNALFLRELKGSAMLDWWALGDRAAFQDMMACVLDERSAVVAGVEAGPANYPPIELELLVLPLRHHGKTHARLLGSLAAARPVSWFGLHPIGDVSLSTFRHVLRRRVRAAPSPVPPQSDQPLQRGRFTVYEGGRSLTRYTSL